MRSLNTFTRLPALELLVRDLERLAEAREILFRLGRDVYWSPDPSYFDTGLKDAIWREAVELYRNRPEGHDKVPPDPQQVLLRLAYYLSCLKALEGIWEGLGAYPRLRPASEDPAFEMKTFFSEGSWSRVQSFFGFDDSE